MGDWTVTTSSSFISRSRQTTTTTPLEVQGLVDVVFQLKLVKESFGSPVWSWYSILFSGCRPGDVTGLGPPFSSSRVCFVLSV